MSLICPCQAAQHPHIPSNPPGLAALDYRVGDFASFRDALLQSRPGELELAGWRPTATGDLALQLLEWWAYLADILTFYNERIANEAYLATSMQPGGVERLVRVLGYRRRPGIGAVATLAALTSGKRGLTLPAGFAVQSKPGPGKQPEVFELSASSATFLSSASRGVVPVELSVDTVMSSAKSLLLRGSLTSIKPGDTLVIAAKQNPKAANSKVLSVLTVASESDPRGVTNTRVTFNGAIGLPGTASSYRLLRSDQFVPLFPYAGFPTLSSKQAHLAQVVRAIVPGDLVLFETTGAPRPLAVTGYEEVLWYSNNPSSPTNPPTAANAVPLAVPHTMLVLESNVSSGASGFTQAAAQAQKGPGASVKFAKIAKSSKKVQVQQAEQAKLGSTITTGRVRYDLRPVGEILREPVSTPTSATTLSLKPLAPLPAAATQGARVIVQDASGSGALATLDTVPSKDELRLTASRAGLMPPLDVLFNLFDVSRGKTVARETLGSGDATKPAQSFTLQKSPLTYLAGGDPSFPSSTLRVFVDGLEWREVPSFFGQAPSARVFVTREDEAQVTRVSFGDGVNGARLPTGTNNVIASYRFGSGKGGPDATSLATVLKPVPGLQGVKNPIAASGGDDPTPAAQVRIYAPRSVLTFGRAISANDYEAIALQAPSVTRARAYYTWDPQHQRALVKLYVGDDDGARAAAQQAVDAASDPNRPLRVLLGLPVNVGLAFSLVVAPDRLTDDVVAAVKAALLGGDASLFAPGSRRPGDALYGSQIAATCLAVPGAVGLRDLELTRIANPKTTLPGPRYDPGEGGFFVLDEARLTITAEVSDHG